MTNKQTENEATFLSWLSSQVSPSQMSELFSAYNEIEKQAKKTKIVHTSIYESLDIASISRIRAGVERSKIFRFTHKRQWNRILSALGYLQKFASIKPAEDGFKSTAPSEIKQGTSETVGIIQEAEATVTTQKKTEEKPSFELRIEATVQRPEMATTDNVVNFDSIGSLAFTKPVSISYFEDVRPESSWKALYVDACALLFDDYPDIFKRLRSENVFGSGKKWLTDAEHIDSLAVPKKVADGFYVETNRNATDLIKNLKWLLDMCSVDYENMVIIYTQGTDAPAEQKDLQAAQTVNQKARQYIRPDKEAFYRWMLEEKHKAEKTCKGYVSAIRTAEKFAQERDLASYKLFTDNPDEAKATAEALFANPEFARFNTDRHNQFSAAISMLLAFYSDKQEELNTESPFSGLQCAEVESDQSASDSEIDAFLAGDEFEPLRNVLSARHITTVDELRSLKLWPFMNRHNIYSIGMRQSILSKVNALLYPVAEIDEAQAYVLHVGDSCYKGVSPAEAFSQYCNDMLSRYPLQIRLLIGMRTQNGAIPIHKDGEGTQALKLTNLSAFIRADLSVEDVISYTNWIRNRCGEDPLVITVSKPEHEEATIEQVKSDDAGIAKTMFKPEETSKESSQQRINACVQQIEQIVLAADMLGITYDDAKEAMNTTMVATKHAVADSEHVVEVKGRLIHEDAFVDWEDGANQLEAIIDKLMQKNSGYISAAQLYEYAKVEMNMFLTDNDVNDERSVYDIAAHLFDKKSYHNKHYVFSGKLHISRPDHPVTSNLDIFRNYATDQGGVFSFDSLVEYLQGIGVATGNLRAQMRMPDEPFFFYYESGVLMGADSMHIDKAWKATVKQELAALFSDVGSYIILRSIPQSWLERLPALPGHRSWTPLLVQSVLRCYSKELGAKTIQALSGQSFDTVHTMLVANDSPVQSFGDVVISYLIDNDIKRRTFDAEELRLLLVEGKMIHGNELVGNMPKVLGNDERFAWNASGDHVTVEV